MCCFSSPVEVYDTSIFGRLTGEGRQVLVYQMRYQALQPTAMILPLPVALPAREDAVHFIDLKGYPRFFDELRAAFERSTMMKAASKGLPLAASAPMPQLAVHAVGDFVASFVPTLKDFKRLDRRFVLPEGVWESLPQYADYGFAVFQLEQLSGTPHPMAFSFPTRLTESVFFPTVHIHDGRVHPREHFDHVLYAQGVDGPRAESLGALGEFLRNPLAERVAELRAPAVQWVIKGMHANEDLILPAKDPAFWTALPSDKPRLGLIGGTALLGALALRAAQKSVRPKQG